METAYEAIAGKLLSLIQTMIKAQDTRKTWLDDIRVWATIAVITIHVSTPAVFTGYNPHSATNTLWWTGNVFDSLSRFCVPVFVMITGALLLPQDIGLKDFLSRRLNRILLPFAFWSAVYIAFNLGIKFLAERSLAFNNFGTWLLGQAVSGAAPHLWYVYMIIGIYLFIPIIKPWITSASNGVIIFFLAIWLVTLIGGQQQLIHLKTDLDLRYFSGYLGYLILGYFIAERLVVTRQLFMMAIISFAAGFLITLIGAYYVTQAQGTFSHRFYEYLTVNVLLASAGAFIIAKGYHSNKTNAIFIKLRQLITKFGYGIYLSHLLILDLVWHFKLDLSQIIPIVGIPLATVVCLTISSLIVILINKLPYGKYISG